MTDASEREREILIQAAEDAVCSTVIGKRTAAMLRADAETIRALKETRDHWIGLADVRYEQLAALTKQNVEILAEMERVRDERDAMIGFCRDALR